MNKIRQWLGIGLRWELNKTQIALGVAREITENWKGIVQNHEKQIRELIAENERFKLEHAKLTEEYDQLKRCEAKMAEALSGRITQPKKP